MLAPLEQELSVVLSCPPWVLGIKLLSPARAALTPAPVCGFLRLPHSALHDVCSNLHLQHPKASWSLYVCLLHVLGLGSEMVTLWF